MVQRAPLKLQQKLELLRIFLLPTISNSLSLQTVTNGYLLGLDAAARAIVRRILRLQHYTPLGFFMPDVGKGGLGLTAFQTAVPFFGA